MLFRDNVSDEPMMLVVEVCTLVLRAMSYRKKRYSFRVESHRSGTHFSGYSTCSRLECRFDKSGSSFLACLGHIHVKSSEFGILEERYFV